MFNFSCSDCVKFGNSCKDMTGTEPAGGCFVSEQTLKYFRLYMTKTQYKYWYDYYVNDMKLVDISIKYDVHITTVCKVLKNARQRINAFYGKAVCENG